MTTAQSKTFQFKLEGISEHETNLGHFAFPKEGRILTFVYYFPQGMEIESFLPAC